MFAIIDTTTDAILEFPILDLAVRFPNTSFPKDPVNGSLPDNIVYIEELVKPVPNLLQKHVVQQPTKDPVTGKWSIGWDLVSMTQAEITASMVEVKGRVSATVQNMLDDFARTKDYDNIMSACSYINSSNVTRAQEAQTAINLRDQVWDTLIAYYTDVELGNVAPPTTEDEILALLPPLVWG